MLPEGWSSAELGDVVDRPIAYGVLKPETASNGIPMLRINNVSVNGQLNPHDLMRITPEQSEEYRRTRLRQGDLALSVVGTIGRIFEIPGSLAGANMSRALCVIGIADPTTRSFIQHILRGEVAQEWMQGLVIGNAQKVLNLGVLRTFSVPLPPRPEQRRIAATLDAWDVAITVAERLVNALHRRKRVIALALFSDPHNPFSVRGVPLQDVATVAYGKGVAPTEYQDSGEVWVIGTQGLMARTAKPHQHGPAVIVGRKGTLNRPMYVPPHQAFAAIDTTFILRPIDAMLSRALFHYLRHIDLAKLNEASGVPSVSADTLRSLPIPLLDYEQADILDACDNQLRLAADQVSVLRRQKRGLMQQLLTGKLRVPDSIDALLPPAPALASAA